MVGDVCSETLERIYTVRVGLDGISIVPDLLSGSSIAFTIGQLLLHYGISIAVAIRSLDGSLSIRLIAICSFDVNLRDGFGRGKGISIALIIHSLDPSLSTQLIVPLISAHPKTVLYYVLREVGGSGWKFDLRE